MARFRNDRIAATRPLLDSLVTNSQKCYIHNECVTVDEELYPFRGRCSYIQYMPSKPARYGLKFWVLADAQSYYVSYASMYTGKDQTVNRGSRSLGEQVVMNATRHVSEGRNVTTNNFFTGLLLARELRKRNLSLLGTIRSHRREITLAVRSHHNRELYSSKFLFTTVDQTPIWLVSYKAKKNKKVVMICSAHNSGSINQSDPIKKPIFFQYNETKSDVNLVERMIEHYSLKYKFRRWHVVVSCSVLDIACYNSFVLFSEVFPEDESNNNYHKRRLFLINLRD